MHLTKKVIMEILMTDGFAGNELVSSECFVLSELPLPGGANLGEFIM